MSVRARRGSLASFLVAASLATTARAGGPPLGAEREVLAQKLIQFCRPCHGIGKRRFLRSEDPAEIWTTITTELVPDTKTLWREAMITALSWPDATPPAPGTGYAPGKEWMPKGALRGDLASDTVPGEATRSFLVRVLQAGER